MAPSAAKLFLTASTFSLVNFCSICVVLTLGFWSGYYCPTATVLAPCSCRFTSQRGCSSVVERSLCMREARGSKPRTSTLSCLFRALMLASGRFAARWAAQLNSRYLVSICRLSRGYSSVVEHSTADREVLGSNPSVPCHFRFCSSWQ